MEEKTEGKTIEYFHPMFHRRVFADIVDALVMLTLAILLFAGFRAILLAAPESTMRSKRMADNKTASGLYVESEGQFALLSAYYPDNSGTLSSQEVMEIYEKGLTTFFTYLGTEVSSEAESTVKTDYDAFRLAQSYEGVTYFVESGGTIVKNSAASMSYQQYSDNVYRPYYSDHAEGYFTVYAPHFVEDARYFSLYLVLIEVPVSILIASILAFYVPPLFFKRGRQTLGKALYKIGRVDSHFLAVKFGRYSAESAILIVAIVMLSLLSFGIPLLISFSLMAFSKKKQDFPDYMLGIEEVDLTDSKIYYCLEEAELELERQQTAHIDFEVEPKP
jgi:hypothetical protein